jgi:ribosomal protein S18 acetylase RimI-like enzyme
MSDLQDGAAVRVGPERFDVVQRTLGRAFTDDPVWTWLVRGPAVERRAGLALASIARVYLRLGGEVWMTRSGEAVAVWAGPEVPSATGKDFLRVAPAMTRALRPSGLRRIAEFEKVDAKHPAEPHWYLAILGTDPAHQRRGHGARVMEPALDRADQAGVGCYLESSKEDNVPYYRRYGFEVTEEVTLAGGRGPTIWLMWREPR